MMQRFIRKRKIRELIIFVIPSLLGAAQGSEIDDDYSPYLRNPRLIMNLSSTKRKDVLEWVEKYKAVTVFACAAKVEKEKTKAKAEMRKRRQLTDEIEQEKTNHAFYLKELSVAEERWQELTTQKMTLKNELEVVLRKMARDRHNEKTTYLQEEARKRREERGWFGFLEDTIWGRSIEPTQTISSIKKARDNEISLYRSKITFIDRKIEANAEKRVIAAFNIKESSTKMRTLEVSLFGEIQRR